MLKDDVFGAKRDPSPAPQSAGSAITTARLLTAFSTLTSVRRSDAPAVPDAKPGGQIEGTG